MSAFPITRERIDELLRFIPELDGPWPDTDPESNGVSLAASGGALTMPRQTYPPSIDEFFLLAGQECWCDFEYDPTIAGQLVRSKDAIASASLVQIKTMLTFCVRAERFCEGHWSTMIRGATSSPFSGASSNSDSQSQPSVPGRSARKASSLPENQAVEFVCRYLR